MERQRHPGWAHPEARLVPDIASLYPGYKVAALVPAQEIQQRVAHDQAPVRFREKIELFGEVRHVLAIWHLAALVREIAPPETTLWPKAHDELAQMLGHIAIGIGLVRKSR